MGSIMKAFFPDQPIWTMLAAAIVLSMAALAMVRVKPGDTALTRTPARPHSAASVCVSWMTPALAAV